MHKWEWKSSIVLLFSVLNMSRLLPGMGYAHTLSIPMMCNFYRWVCEKLCTCYVCFWNILPPIMPSFSSSLYQCGPCWGKNGCQSFFSQNDPVFAHYMWGFFWQILHLKWVIFSWFTTHSFFHHTYRSHIRIPSDACWLQPRDLGLVQI